jgi:methylaspartate mutase epsilon subunit
MKQAHRLLIGSVGDDIHSVGMALLTIAFRESDFVVRNLGILNDLDDFFHLAPHFDAILISCNNGHADLYLEDFPRKLAAYKLSDPPPVLWYLGGCLSVQNNSEAVMRKYIQLGFDHVAPKPVGWEVVLGSLTRELERARIPKRDINSQPEDKMPPLGDLSNISDEPMSDAEFESARTEVLNSWPTGSGVIDTDIKASHADPVKNLHHVIVERLADGSGPLLQPRTGVAHVSDEIDILQYLRRQGLDVSSIQLDAASRKNLYAEAAEGVRRTEKGKKSFLNGYPVPVHGVPGMKEILAAIDNPFQIRAGSPDHRLVYEIGLAGGASSLEGGFICYLFPYDKILSPVANLSNWKYVDKLTGHYQQKHGITINREYFGPLTTSLIEPTIPICINIVQAILSAKSGVKCISVGCAEQGNRHQDIAAIHVLRQTTGEYLARYGHSDCTVSTVYHHYMAAFPSSPEKARDLIINSSVTGALAGASRILVKTPVESYGIPSKEDNGEALRLTRQGIKLAANTNTDHKRLKVETEQLYRQVCAIMTRIEELGRGSVARGAMLAFQTGALDIQFSPSVYNSGRLLSARDCDGAVRFLNPERLPFDEQTRDFHLEKMSQRKTAERLSHNAQILALDLTRIGKDDFVRWPLDGTYVA